MVHVLAILGLWLELCENLSRLTPSAPANFASTMRFLVSLKTVVIFRQRRPYTQVHPQTPLFRPQQTAHHQLPTFAAPDQQPKEQIRWP